MSEQDIERFGDRVRAIAQALPYPAAARSSTRTRIAPSFRLRPALILFLVLAVIGVLMLTPVRAQVLRWLRIGAVQIVLPEPAETPISTATPARPIRTANPTTAARLTAIVVTRTPGLPRKPNSAAILDGLPGRSTLVEARRALTDQLKLPAFPGDLGDPDDVFVFSVPPFAGGLPQDAAILAWRERADPALVRMSLHIIRAPLDSILYTKISPRVVREVRVGTHRAVWVEGNHWISLRGGELLVDYFVTGTALIWTDGAVTYRLETALSLEEAMRVAESLR